MTVTILVPVYGVEKYIQECAESLFQQTYPDIEFVFCDDCTPDKSMEVLKEIIGRFPKRNIRIIRNESNIGLGGTRRHLISEIKSDYFMIVDSDDYLPKNAVENLVLKMHSSDTDIVEGGYSEIKAGNILNTVIPDHSSKELYVKKVLCQNIITLQVWGKLYKSAILSKIPNLFIDGIDFAEDICATSRLAAVTSRSWTDEVVYYYRTNNAMSYTNNISLKNIMSYFRACSTVLNFYQQRGQNSLTLEIGILNAYRECRKSNISPQIADNIIQYEPRFFLMQILFWMFRIKYIPLQFTDYLYRVIRIASIHSFRS